MDRERLGDQVNRRRRALGLSASQAARDAGLSRTTWIAIEDGSRSTQKHNYGPVERVLRWREGSIEAILAGDEPAELAIAERQSDAGRPAHSVITAVIAILDHPKLSDSEKVRHARQLIAGDYVPGAGESSAERHLPAG